MKIVSFNVNSVRLRLPQLEAVIAKHNPEFIGLQETKVQDHDFPVEAIQDMGYQVIFMGQKTHYGVALLSRTDCVEAQMGFPEDDDEAQKRFIGGHYRVDGDDWYIYNGYFPQGESRQHPVKFPAKQKYYQDLINFLSAKHNSTQRVVVMGDYNIAPEDSDIGIGMDNAKRWIKTGKSSFLPEEREWFQSVCELGYFDGFRLCYPNENNLFSWFDYRSKGFEREPRRGLRIDHLMVSETLKNSVTDAGIDYDIRSMPKPSDHAPAWVKITKE